MQGLEDSQASTFEWIKTEILLKLIEDSRTITVALEQTSNFNSNFINIVHSFSIILVPNVMHKLTLWLNHLNII